MIRRSAGVLGVLLALLVGAASSVAEEVSGGPRLALMRLNDAKIELVTTNSAGSDVHAVVQKGGSVEPFPLTPPSWSADGRKLAFLGAQAEGEFQLDIYVQELGGGEPVLVSGTRSGTRPLLSPDGHTVAFSRFKPGKAGKAEGRRPEESSRPEYAVWIADLNGGVVRRITPYRPRVSDFASSFSPDGSTLALTRRVAGGPPEVVALDLSNGRATVLARRASEPVYSPDGSRIAFKRMALERVRNHPTSKRLFSDLYVMGADGSGVSRLTRTAGLSEWQPAWDPSGQRLSFLETQEAVWRPEVPLRAGVLEEVNADGSCRTPIPAAGTRVIGGAWQPGPAREAGPISC